MLSIQSVDTLPREAQVEAAKTLALAIGVRPAARELGIPEPTLQAWSARYEWFKPTPQPPTITNPRGATIATKTPSQALNAHLEQQKHKTRSNLAKFTVNASKVAARSRNPVEIAGKVRDVATVMEKVWPEEKGSTGFTLNLGILNQSVK